MDNPKFRLAWLIVLDNYVDIQSKLIFEQAGDYFKELVDESFEQTIHLRGSDIHLKELAKNLILRCGKSLRTIELEMIPGRLFQLHHENRDDMVLIRILAKQSPKLIKIPSNSFVI